MILLDTNVLSELMRPRPDRDIVNWLDSFPREEVFLSSITVAEILYGIAGLPGGKRKNSLLQAATGLFEVDFKGHILSFDEKAAVEYAAVITERERVGRPISMADALIAGICRVSACPLATRNTRDFEATGVELIDPWRETAAE